MSVSIILETEEEESIIFSKKLHMALIIFTLNYCIRIRMYFLPERNYNEENVNTTVLRDRPTPSVQEYLNMGTTFLPYMITTTHVYTPPPPLINQEQVKPSHNTIQDYLRSKQPHFYIYGI